MLRHRLAVGAGGGGEDHPFRQDAGGQILVGPRPHGLEPLQAGGAAQVGGPGPPEKDGGLFQLLRCHSAPPGADVDGPGGRLLKGSFFLLGHRQQIQIYSAMGEPPFFKRQMILIIPQPLPDGKSGTFPPPAVRPMLTSEGCRTHTGAGPPFSAE